VSSAAGSCSFIQVAVAKQPTTKTTQHDTTRRATQNSNESRQQQRRRRRTTKHARRACLGTSELGASNSTTVHLIHFVTSVFQSPTDRKDLTKTFFQKVRKVKLQYNIRKFPNSMMLHQLRGPIIQVAALPRPIEWTSSQRVHRQPTDLTVSE